MYFSTGVILEGNGDVFYLFPEVLKVYGSRLTEYERAEIDKFPEIWYLGLDSAKVLGRPGAPLNSGFDDDNGSYNKVRKVNDSFRNPVLK